MKALSLDQLRGFSRRTYARLGNPGEILDKASVNGGVEAVPLLGEAEGGGREIPIRFLASAWRLTDAATARVLGDPGYQIDPR